jgi:hypothetical protein
LYEDIDEVHGSDLDQYQMQDMDASHSNQRYYSDALHGPSGDQQYLMKPSVNEFRICYSRPKFPRRNLTTERLAEPK